MYSVGRKRIKVEVTCDTYMDMKLVLNLIVNK
jgi:hypothetical protein